MSRDIVDADTQHYHACIKVLVLNYPEYFVRSMLETTLDNLGRWYEDKEEQNL